MPADRMVTTVKLSAAALFLCLCAFVHGAAAGQDGTEVSLVQAREMIEAGDANVVPVLREWLQEYAAHGRASDQDDRPPVAMWGLGAFRDEESLPVITQLYHKLRPRGDFAPAAAYAIAAAGSKADLNELKEILWVEELPLEVHCRAAEALIRLDEDVGREFLLLQYDLYRLEHRTMSAQRMGEVHRTLERLHDEKVLKGLQERLAGETDRQMQNNIKSLCRRMEFNGEPVESLKLKASNPSWKDGSQRHDAIEALGRRGGPEMIPFLESLQPWEGCDFPWRQEELKKEMQKAVGEIKRAHWQDRQPAGAGIKE